MLHSGRVGKSCDQGLTKASWRPMLPIVMTPAKKMQGSQERMYRKSGEVYLSKEGSDWLSLSLAMFVY